MAEQPATVPAGAVPYVPHHGRVGTGCPVECLLTVLSRRSFNRLAGARDASFGPPRTVGDVIRLAAGGQLGEIRGLGRRGISEIAAALVLAGLDITAAHDPGGDPQARKDGEGAMTSAHGTGTASPGTSPVPGGQGQPGQVRDGRGGLRAGIATPGSRPPGMPAVWWARDFPGSPDQAREVRHWVRDLLPDCDPLADLLLAASELCANAVVHTRSGEAGGRFSVTVEWTPALARVVIGDQGSPTVPSASVTAGDTAWAEESGRGLWLVDELADDWGTASHPGGRWVWADVAWRARGGPPPQVPGGIDAAIADIALVRGAFPGAAIWWGHRTRAWQAAVPDAGGQVSSATPGGLSQALADAYPGISPWREDPLVNLACSHPTGKRSEKRTDMTAARCSCGFTELDDETITDHLHSVFEPDDRKGTDGQVHEEGQGLACWCGFAAATPDDLDGHFLKVFMPSDGIGRDGNRHEAIDGG